MALGNYTSLPTPHKRMAIIGSGFSGTKAAIHALENATEPLEIMLIEKSEGMRYGGKAYSAETASEAVVTNLPISRMSAFDKRPNDLVEWVQRADRTNWPLSHAYKNFAADEYLPRQLYQLYLKDRLKEAEARNPMVHVTRKTGEVADIIQHLGGKSSVVLADGTAYEANTVFAATGWTKPKEAPFTQAIKNSKRYISDVYSLEGRERLAHIPRNDTVFIPGTGMKAYDAAAELLQQGHRGTIILSSRGGHTHAPYPIRGLEPSFKITTPPEFTRAITVPELLTKLRQDFLHRTITEGHSTERVIEAYQPYIPDIIKKFPQKTVRDLLTEHNSLIATHRVGTSFKVVSRIDNAEANGQLKILSANIHDMQLEGSDVAIRLTQTGASEASHLKVQHVISGLGSETIKDDFWQRLIARGAAKEHFTGSGIVVGERGQLVNALGQESQSVIAIGPMRGGDTLARHGIIGPPAFSVPGMRARIEDSVDHALNYMRQQTRIVSQPQHIDVEPVHSISHKAGSLAPEGDEITKFALKSLRKTKTLPILVIAAATAGAGWAWYEMEQDKSRKASAQSSSFQR